MPIATRSLAVIAAFMIVVAACGAATGSGGGLGASFPPGFTIPPLASTNPLPGTNAGCQQLNAPIAGFAQVEADIRAGTLTGAAAQAQVLAVRQVVGTVGAQVGAGTPLGLAITGVVDALDDLGSALNESSGLDKVMPALDAVNAAIARLETACQAAG